jgi:hypothetical protein
MKYEYIPQADRLYMQCLIGSIRDSVIRGQIHAHFLKVWHESAKCGSGTLFAYFVHTFGILFLTLCTLYLIDYPLSCTLLADYVQTSCIPILYFADLLQTSCNIE